MANKSSDVFTNNRIIYVTGEIDEDKSQEVIKSLLEFEVRDPTKDIHMFIDSYGGYVDSFLPIYDVIQMINSDVATVCIGKSFSSAAYLLMGGTKGKRFITKNSRTLIHELSSNLHGKLSEMNHFISEYKNRQEMINKIILKHTNINENDLDMYIKKDSFFDSEKSKSLGIVDNIVECYSEIFKN